MKLFTMIVAGAVLIGGVSVGAQVFTKEDTESNLQIVHQAETVAIADVSPNNAGITLSEAKDIALAKVENGIVTEAERDREDGRIIYEIEVKNEHEKYEFDIDQQSGEIIKEKVKQRNQKREKSQSTRTTENNNSIISIDQAKEIALNEVSGKIDEIELERENGVLIYEVEIETEQYDDDDEATVYIDAITGKVLYVEWDD
ncbi:PepSY domain-containing protein [Alkalihalobacterium elongatum]|uniref:PepSY domain-containing protein n=1 Tax=Alkalihalobacterium elongatum TaxID=2675466 RepID=UPI001C200A12|nr:PepSY domain-containing protein [Alkalihalobacterium elongatum]